MIAELVLDRKGFAFLWRNRMKTWAVREALREKKWVPLWAPAPVRAARRRVL